MPEIRSWDTTFFVKTLNRNIGLRVYYEADRESCTVSFGGQTREFGVEKAVFNDNPKEGDTTTLFYEFNVVAGKPYAAEEDGRRFACMDIKADAVQKTEIKNSTMRTVFDEFVEDGRQHRTTVRLECRD